MSPLRLASSGIFTFHCGTMVGTTPGGQSLVLAVIDGRRAQLPGVTSLEMIPLMEEFGVSDAMNLDGGGNSSISTGISFFDHMLEQLGRHGGFALTVHTTGDLHVDDPRAAASLSRPVRRLSVPEQLDRLWRIYQEPRPALSPGRKRVGFALLAAGGLTLGAAVLVSLLGSRYNTPGHCFALGRDDCIDRGLNLSTSGYAIGGGLALAGMLTLALPERRKGLR